MKLFLCGDTRTSIDMDREWNLSIEERRFFTIQKEIDRGISLRSADDEILRRLLRTGGWES